jgi:two-component system sensor histidine kinase UhpB
MTLRFRLICLIAIVLAVSLALEGTIVFFNASRSVQTEMHSALQVGEQIIKGRLARLAQPPGAEGSLEDLVAAFKGSRHLRVRLAGGAASAEPSHEASHFGSTPAWFIRLLGVAPVAVRLRVPAAGQGDKSIVIETDPSNEILEVWNDLGDNLIVLTLFFGLNIVLVYFFIGRTLRPLDSLAKALKQVGQGDYKLRIGDSPVPELSRLGRSFNAMAVQLSAMDEQNRRLNEQLLTLQEEERAQIARDLHDEISPFLFAVNVDLAAVTRLAGQGRSAEIAGQVQLISESVSHMQRQVRAMLGRLRPGALADFGLIAAIMSIVEFWRQRYSRTRFLTDLPPEGTSFGSMIDLSIYRIIQESLSNALRHGNPAEISVSVATAAACATAPGCIKVEVANDGEASAPHAGSGFGLIGMQERVRALGGCLAVIPKPGLGLSVAATIPIPGASAQLPASSGAEGA